MRTSLVLLVALGSMLPACSHSGGEPAGASTVAPASGSPVYRIPIEGLPVLGDPKALVTIVEFTDYECSYCRDGESIVAKLRSHYGSAVRVVLAERPMAMHPAARPAALAALAAGAQGHLEGMHARLFAGPLDEASILQAARAEGLDLARFDADRQGSAVAALGRAEQVGNDFGVPGTPAFFINGRKVIGPQPIATFEEIIDERLETARRLVAAGVAPEKVYEKATEGGVPHFAEDC